MDAQYFFNQHPIFRFEEFLEAVQMEQGRSQAARNNARTLLHYYCKKNRLINIRQGLYLVRTDKVYETNLAHPLFIAGKATDDAVIAYHSALESHGIAYTDFNEHIFVTKHRSKPFEFQDQLYRPITHSQLKPLNEEPQIEAITVMGVTIYRTTLERTIVDVLHRTNLSGGWEEIMRSLDRITTFNTDTAVNYALSLNKASIAAKLGYFLDNQPSYFKAQASIINQLLNHIPKQPYYIDRHAQGKQIYIKKWRIMVPQYIHERLWEENDELAY